MYLLTLRQKKARLNKINREHEAQHWVLKISIAILLVIMYNVDYFPRQFFLFREAALSGWRVRVVGSLHTFLKYVTPYDTFASAKCRGLCRGLKDKTFTADGGGAFRGWFAHPRQHENQKTKAKSKAANGEKHLKIFSFENILVALLA